MESGTSGPLRRKFSNSFSGINAFNHIFSGKPKVGAQNVSSRVEDYKEIFAGAGSSSIPVLDLSADNDPSESVNFRSSELDYSNIFGGFRDEGIGVPYEELVCNAEQRGERKVSGNIRTGSPSKSSDHSSLSKENQTFSSEAPYWSFNDKKHFNMSFHKTSAGSRDGSNGTIHVAQSRPEPGFTFFVDDNTPQMSKTDQPDFSVTSEIRRKLDFSNELLGGHHNKKAMPHVDTKKPNRRQVDSASGFNQDGSYSNGELLNAHVINLKPNSTNERPSPHGAAHKGNSNGFTKRSIASNTEAPKVIASEQAKGYDSLPFFDQELDVNSDAAASAAALEDAIQKAQEIIQMAKELMERKKDGLQNRPNRDIKDGLKVEARKENASAHEGNRTQNKNVKDTSESIISFSNVFSGMGWKGAFTHGKDAPDFKYRERTSSLREVTSDVHLKNLDTTKKCESAPSTMLSIGKNTTGTLSSNEQSVSRSKIRQFMEKCNYDIKERTASNETLKKQVIVKKEEEDEKAHDLGFIKGKVHAVIMETETEENVDRLACNVHEHVGTETPLISQGDENYQKTLLESQQNVEEKMKFECHELKYTDYEKILHKTQEQDQNKQLANSQQEHLEKGAENTKEESECTTRNIFDVEVERFEDAIEWVENENEPKSSWSESDGEKKKVTHMAEDVESEWGHPLTTDDKRSTVHDGEESGENIQRFQLKGSANDVRSCYGDETIEEIEIESEEIQVLKQAHFKSSMSRKSDPWIHDASNNNATFEGTFQLDMVDDNYSRAKQQVDDKSRSIDKATKECYDFKVGEAEAKIACKELSETARLVHGAAEGSQTRNKMKTVFEVLPSEESMPKFGLTEMELENTEAEQRDRDFKSNINSDISAQILVNRSVKKGYIFEENKIYCEEEAEKITHEIANGEGQMYSGSVSSKNEKVVEVDKEIRARQITQMNEKNVSNTTAQEDKETEKMKTENIIDDKEGHPREVVAKNETETRKADPKGADKNVYLGKISEENNRVRQRERDKVAVERAIQEARDRAFAQARERAAVDRAAKEVRPRVMVKTEGELEKSTTTAKTSADKASIEAKIRSERAAVERATAEARQRALEKALSQRAASRAEADKSATENVSASFRDTPTKRSDGTTTESAQRSKARSERQERILERAAKALADKNMRDLHIQKEEAEKNRLAESLDTEIKRWSTGKEGNLCALLSTLQYILGPGSGWQPISLTDIITTNAVKKAYRKATLYVHPDKLQQRGASIREKYICEKVFDLLKVAWNRFNSEEN